MKRYKTHIRRVIMALLLLIFTISIAIIVSISYQRQKSDEVYHTAAIQYKQMTTNQDFDKDEKIRPPKTIDFAALQETNPDIIGWIYCENTNIDYPVLKGETNDTYLRTDYTKEYNINGSIFVDCDNASDFSDANTIIYGHHMNHGAMFATLDSWSDQRYYNEHPYMWLFTPEVTYQVVLISGHHTSAASDFYKIYSKHDINFHDMLKEAIEQSDFKPIEKATVNENRNYIMLTTCAYIFDNARYVIHGKLVPIS